MANINKINNNSNNMTIITSRLPPETDAHIIKNESVSTQSPYGNLSNKVKDKSPVLSALASSNRGDHLAALRTTLLAPNEVTFCNLSDDEHDDETDDDYNIEIDKNGNSIQSTKRRRRLTSTTTDQSDTDSIISSVNPNQKKKPEIPDGGYGWVVVFASLVVSLIADGISFSFGLLYSELLIYFKESKSKTAWIGSLFMAVPLLSGPIMSNLVDKYGCRKMTILGGFLAGSGFVLASFCQSIEQLYFTFGIIAGLGLGLGYVTAVVSIAFWFDNKRTFATGIGASGTGIGTFLYAPFTQWLIETYGWRGTTLILAGTIFNMCVCGCLMRDPDWLIEENRLESRSQSIQTFSNSSVCLDEIKKMLETGAPKESVLDTLVTNYNTEANQQITIPETIAVAKKYQSEMLLPTYMETQKEFLDGRHASRRSLRQDINTHNYVDNKTSPTVTATIQTPKTVNLVDHLASSETLNTWEKITTSDDDTETIDEYLQRNNGKCSSNSIDEGYLSTKRYNNDNEKNYWACSNSDRLSSRLSLDESLINKPTNNDDNIKNRNNRGNSLDILYENEIFKVNPNDKNEEVINIPFSTPNNNNNNNNNNDNIKEKDSKRNYKRNLRYPIPTNGNLKRNISLRNSNYFKNMRVHRNSIHYRGAMLNTHRYRLRASSCPNIYRNSMTTIAREDDETWYDSFVDIIKSVFDFSLFKDIKFFMFNLSILFLFIWFIIPYFYITEHLLIYGYTEEDSANLIAIIGFFNTIGMIFLGWVGDQPWLNVTKTYAVCLVVCGISVSLIPLAVHSYTLLIILCILFGITFASSFSFTPIILVSLVDLDDFTCAYGLVLLVQGIGNLVGPPIAGIIYEWTLRWDDTFYAAGFFIAVSGALAYVTGILQERDYVENDIDVINGQEQSNSSTIINNNNNNNNTNNNNNLSKYNL